MAAAVVVVDTVLVEAFMVIVSVVAEVVLGTGCYSDNGNSRGGDRGNGGIGSGGCSVYGSSGGGYRRNGGKRGRNKSARLLVQWFW